MEYFIRINPTNQLITKVSDAASLHTLSEFSALDRLQGHIWRLDIFSKLIMAAIEMHSWKHDICVINITFVIRQVKLIVLSREGKYYAHILTERILRMRTWCIYFVLRMDKPLYGKKKPFSEPSFSGWLILVVRSTL